MRALTVEEMIFVGEYLIDGNAARAARVMGYTGDYAGEEGFRQLKKPQVADEIQRCTEVLRGRVPDMAELVVRDIKNVLETDPRDLMEYVTGSCRHCHGKDHEYQFTIGELKYSRKVFYADPTNEGKVHDDKGGPGYKAFRDPHPDCPECDGKGHQHPRLKDTRHLTREQAALFNGIEQTRHGIKIHLRDKDKARADAARILGLNKDTMDVTVTKKLEDCTDEELQAIVRAAKENGK